jgi:hypothetical protein
MLIRNRIYKISIIFIILSSFIPATLVSKSAEAAIVNSQIMSPKKGYSQSREVDLSKIRKMLENRIVAEKLRSHGLSTEEVNKKIAKMGDEQIHQMASLSDRIPAGGDAGAAALIVIVVIAVAIILLLVLGVLNRKG